MMYWVAMDTDCPECRRFHEGNIDEIDGIVEWLSDYETYEMTPAEIDAVKQWVTSLPLGKIVPVDRSRNNCRDSFEIVRLER